MKKSFIIFLFLLTACGDSSNDKGADGYYFEKETFTRTNFNVEIVLLKSEAELIAELRKRSGDIRGDVNPKNVAAFSVLNNQDTSCKIYLLDPKIQYEPEWLGHELTHCIYGYWHQESQPNR